MANQKGLHVVMMIITVWLLYAAPESAEGDLSSLCLWADRVKFRYHWSSPLHYINTPDACSYQYNSERFYYNIHITKKLKA
jgi:hypothetical protein